MVESGKGGGGCGGSGEVEVRGGVLKRCLCVIKVWRVKVVGAASTGGCTVIFVIVEGVAAGSCIWHATLVSDAGSQVFWVGEGNSDTVTGLPR